MRWRIEFTVPDQEDDGSWEQLAKAEHRRLRFEAALDHAFPWTRGIEVTSAERIDDGPDAEDLAVELAKERLIEFMYVNGRNPTTEESTAIHREAATLALSAVSTIRRLRG